MRGSLLKSHLEKLEKGHSPVDLAREALAAAAKVEGAFVRLCDEEAVEESAKMVEYRLAAGEDLPLAGVPFSVKDNLDVQGMISTSNCPGYGRVARESAPVVQKVLDAGAVLIGRNTMDQFATGLNGTRSPGTLPKNAQDACLIPGGSSSGSGVAVARGVCVFALGSDTGGSGRVPAAANGIVGLKPTPGIISSRGMVYCNRTFDVIPIFAATVADVGAVFQEILGPDALDPFAYGGPVASAESPNAPVIAVPAERDHFGDDDAVRAHDANIEALSRLGVTIREIDFAPFAEAGKLVFESALVAERLVDYGDFIAEKPELVDPSVRNAIEAGKRYSARDAFETLYRLAEIRVEIAPVLEQVDALVLPTIPRLYTVEEMRADPLAKNTVMGTYTYFANPLGLAAIAVPGARRADGVVSSASFVGLGGTDLRLISLAERFESLW